ncbi:hypothetical protein Tco_0600055 [Tanacetum coccineum]|uniref:Uncharacterized protein n=1 Tax=Tanacetum coccineum TaxID=301880 RepID=A0ABQ4WAQ3_9ASTR
MNLIATQQVALDNALVAPEKTLKIEKCNARIEFNKPQREETYQVTLDALKLSPCYHAFLITAETPQLRIALIEPRSSTRDNACFLFIQRSSVTLQGVICYLQSTQIKCAGLGEHLLLSSTGASLESHQDLIGSGHQELKSCGRSSARKENRPYPRFTKVIINHFISKDKTISMRNRKNIYTVRNDTLLCTLKFVSKTQDYQQYGALIPEEMINQDIKDSKAYKTYLAFATGQATPRKARKFKKIASPSKKLSSVLEEEPAVKPKRAKKPSKKSTTVPTLGVVIGDTPGVFVSKKKAPAKVDRGKGMGFNFLFYDVDGDTKQVDSEKTDSDEDENPNLKQNDDEEEWYEVEYVNTSENYEFIDDDEEYEELYKDTKLRLKDAEHEEERKGDEEMTNANRDEETSTATAPTILLTIPPITPHPQQSYIAKFEKKAQAEMKRYIDLVEKSMKDIIKDEVRSLPQILPKEVSEFATPVIQAPLLNHLIMSSWLNLLLN